MKSQEEIIRFYSDEQKKHESIVKRLDRIGRYIVLLRIFFFLLLALGIYWFVSNEFKIHNIFLPLGAIVSFAIISFIDGRNIRKRNLHKELAKTNSIELDHLRGNNSELETGSEFVNNDHPYTSDLDIFGQDSLFQIINRCATVYGKEKLAHSLQNIQFEKNALKEKQIAIEELSSKPKWRQLFAAKGIINTIKETNTTQIKNWTESNVHIKRFLKPLLYILPFINISLIGLSIADIIAPQLPISTSLLQLFIVASYTKKLNLLHKQLDSFVKSLSKFSPLVEVIDNEQFHSEKMKSLANELFNVSYNALHAFKKINKILGIFDQRANVLVLIITNALYMKELHLFSSIEKWKKKYGTHVLKWIDCIGEIDSLNSFANFYFNNPTFTFPRESTSVILKAKNIGHPIINSEKRVYNDFHIDSLHAFYIVTGANMAGKSTFLRTIGVNVILASCGAPVCANEFEFKPLHLFSSMRTADNLAHSTSYFQAELLRLKQLIATVEKGEPTLIILDEILKGTNSLDKLNGSKQFLLKLLKYNVCGLVATHDLALGDLENEMPDTFKNICFEIEHENHEIIYDYKIKEGRSKNMNASILLKEMGLI